MRVLKLVFGMMVESRHTKLFYSAQMRQLTAVLIQVKVMDNVIVFNLAKGDSLKLLNLTLLLS